LSLSTVYKQLLVLSVYIGINVQNVEHSITSSFTLPVTFIYI